MMLVVIGRKGECQILMHDFCLEDRTIPLDHFVETTRLADNGRELHWFDHPALLIDTLSPIKVY
jgi:hypothetical protein